MRLSERRAALLVRVVRYDRVLGQRALRRLRLAGDSGDQTAVDALWEAWLARADTALWELLSRWRRPAAGTAARELSLVALDAGSVSAPEFRAALVDAAARTGHPIAETARARILAAHDPDLADAVCEAALTRPVLLPLCTEHGMTPSNPVRRAIFFLLTGQVGQYRALDPDGGLLSTAYEAADENERARLRTAMTTAGDLDSVRVLTSADRRLGQMRAEERNHLVRTLAGRADWPRLWRLALDLPLAETVTAIRAFHGHWRPDDGRALFERLSHTQPAAVTDTLSPIRIFRIDRDRESYFRECALSPDGTRLAVHTDYIGQAMQITDVELPDRRLVARHNASSLPTSGGPLLHLGEAIIAVADHALVRFAGDDCTVLRSAQKPAALAHTHDGFVATTHGGGLLFGTSGSSTVTETALPDDLASGDRALATHPDTGLIAVGGRTLAVLNQDASRVIAHTTVSWEVDDVVFAGPGHLITTSRNRARRSRLTRWELDGGVLTPQATVEFARWTINELTAVPWHDQVAVWGVELNPVRVHRELKFKPRERIAFLDATTLRTVTAPVDPALLRPRSHHARQLRSTPSGLGLAFFDFGSVVVVRDRLPPRIVQMIERPLADATPADLTTVTRAITDTAPDGEASERLELFRACLEHRFSAEIQIGATPPGPDPDDIALAPGDE